MNTQYNYLWGFLNLSLSKNDFLNTFYVCKINLDKGISRLKAITLECI